MQTQFYIRSTSTGNYMVKNIRLPCGLYLRLNKLHLSELIECRSTRRKMWDRRKHKNAFLALANFKRVVKSDFGGTFIQLPVKRRHCLNISFLVESEFIFGRGGRGQACDIRNMCRRHIFYRKQPLLIIIIVPIRM